MVKKLEWPVSLRKNSVCLKRPGLKSLSKRSSISIKSIDTDLFNCTCNFSSGRKIGKTHQNVLVFVKGDAKKATQAIGAVEFGSVEVDEEIDSPAVSMFKESAQVRNNLEEDAGFVRV